jgi:hypothetical protein
LVSGKNSASVASAASSSIINSRKETRRARHHSRVWTTGDAPQDFRSLAPLELERTLKTDLSQEQFPAILSGLDGGAEWIESFARHFCKVINVLQGRFIFYYFAI